MTICSCATLPCQKGVSGLWAEIKPVAVRQSFEKTALAVFDEAFEGLQDGHPVEKGTTLGLRVGLLCCSLARQSASLHADPAFRPSVYVCTQQVGIDASAWFIHSEKSEGGGETLCFWNNLDHGSSG